MKFDANGNMMLTKLFADPNQATLNLSFLQTVSITVIEDTDIAINGCSIIVPAISKEKDLII